MPVAGAIMTVGSAVLLAVVLRLAGPRWGVVALLAPLALFLEPVRDNLQYGQVNIALMALVSLDCLLDRPPWPRGAGTGLAAALKLTPAVFVLYFLVRRDYRAAAVAAVSCAVATGIGFLAIPRDSVRYWTSLVFQTGRIGTRIYAGNQSLQALLARGGLDPWQPAGRDLWLALSAVVLAVAALGMRRAFTESRDVLALSLNAFAGLLISPVSWTHHWVWTAPALLALAAVPGRAFRLLAGCGAVIFYLAPPWLLPWGDHRELHWTAWQQVAGSSYVVFALIVLLLAAALPAQGHRRTRRDSTISCRPSPTTFTARTMRTIATAGPHSCHQ
jgi:alpha-1,2-mannosyltransferase